MENNKNKEKKRFIKPKIEKDESLGISYNKEEFEDLFPNLISEITKKKGINIEKSSFPEKRHISLGDDESEETSYEESLSNPGVFDFIRRCKDPEDALIIIDYLKDRKEISDELYEKIYKILENEGGLEWLITQCGGLKKPGYYIDKYYSKQNHIE